MKRLFHGSWLLPLYISFDWCSVRSTQPLMPRPIIGEIGAETLERVGSSVSIGMKPKMKPTKGARCRHPPSRLHRQYLPHVAKSSTSRPPEARDHRFERAQQDGRASSAPPRPPGRTPFSRSSRAFAWSARGSMCSSALSRSRRSHTIHARIRDSRGDKGAQELRKRGAAHRILPMRLHSTAANRLLPDSPKPPFVRAALLLQFAGCDLAPRHAQ